MGMYILADLAWWLDFGNWNSLIRMALGLGFVIFVHELGHFLVAKACGVKCEKFYVGFDPPFKYLPRALWKRKWGETEYGIGVIPLGGYVKMLGQDDNPANAAKEAERIRIGKEQQESGEVGEPTANDYQLDPRSYPAKSVPQRMAIISAGVIMNMIFAVIFATVAYELGVSYIPCSIGGTVPGDPAWQAGLQPGDKIVQLGDRDEIDEQLSFTRDLRFAVASTGTQGQLKMTVRRTDDSIDVVSIQPASTIQKQTGLPSIGVFAASSNRVVSGSSEADFVAKVLGAEPSPSEQADSNRLAEGDRIVVIHAGSHRYVIDDQTAYQISGILARHAAEELTFEVERDEDPSTAAPLPTSRSVTIAPLPMRTLGITMEPGPIVAIQQDSPAEKAGLQVGDVIIAVAGVPVREPLQIDDYLLSHVGEPTEIVVLRVGQTQFTLSVTPKLPTNSGGTVYAGGPISAETIGAAIGITNQVQTGDVSVENAIRPGDRVEQAIFVAQKNSPLTSKQIQLLRLSKAMTFGADGDYSWADLIHRIQTMPDDMEIHLTISRGKKQEIVELKPTTSDNWFLSGRDIALKSMSATRTAANVGDAFRLGIQETGASVEQVFFTLKNIRKHYKHLGGPITIAAVATSEASAGLPRLLTFLTLLSANLAIVNFLPIPVLDGGHMMFLLAEGIRGKPVNERWAFYLTMIGFSFILALMVFVISLDVNRLFPGLSG